MKFKIEEEFIKLSQLLKATNLVNTGGEAKIIILQQEVLLNGEICLERNKKIRKGDIIKYREDTIEVI